MANKGNRRTSFSPKTDVSLSGTRSWRFKNTGWRKQAARERVRQEERTSSMYAHHEG